MRLPSAAITGLGIATIVGYGAWFYSFGVLIEPIAQDTGWSQSLLSGTFAGAQLGTGVFASFAGRLLDRVGARPVLLLGALGCVPMAAASWATSPVLFAALYALGGMVVGALSLYHVTMAAAARADASSPDQGIATLTIFGAFSSPVIIPATAWLVEAFGWRSGLRLLMVGIAAGLITAGLAVGRTGHAPATEGARTPMFAAIAASVRIPVVRRMLVANIGAGLATGALLVYQVPVMVTAGLTLATASWFAGARGFLQLGGRVGLMRVVARIGGSRKALAVSYVGIAIGAVVLAFSGNPLLAGAYAVIAGIAIGAMSPLQGIYARERFADEHLGTLMGAQSTAIGLSSAVGPLTAGILLDLTGTTASVIAIGVAGSLLAAGVLATERE